MPLLILADVYRCSDAYSYGSPEHYMAKKYVEESQVADLIKYSKREFKHCSYWFIRITRIDMDKDEFVTTEIITHKNKLKTRIQLNADAKPTTKTRQRMLYPDIMPAPTASLTQMIAQMEAMAQGSNTISPTTGTQPSTLIGPLP